jgi:hypothetical protein
MSILAQTKILATVFNAETIPQALRDAADYIDDQIARRGYDNRFLFPLSYQGVVWAIEYEPSDNDECIIVYEYAE